MTDDDTVVLSTGFHIHKDAAPPECEQHEEVDHDDMQPPWCDECGWSHGTEFVPPRDVRRDLIVQAQNEELVAKADADPEEEQA